MAKFKYIPTITSSMLKLRKADLRVLSAKSVTYYSYIAGTHALPDISALTIRHRMPLGSCAYIPSKAPPLVT